MIRRSRFQRFFRRHALAAVLAVVLLPLATAQADTAGRSREQPRTESVPIPGTDLVRGRTTLVVHAPMAKVRSAVLDYAHYPEFMPYFKVCRVLGRSPSGGRDIYMEVTALNGTVRMWARLDARKAVTIDGVETHELTFIAGNIKDLRATWRLRPLDGERTELSLEIFLHPKIPLPASLLNSENLDGSAKGATAIRARIER